MFAHSKSKRGHFSCTSYGFARPCFAIQMLLLCGASMTWQILLKLSHSYSAGGVIFAQKSGLFLKCWECCRFTTDFLSDVLHRGWCALAIVC